MKHLILALAFALTSPAQTPPPAHSATLTWADTANPAGTTYSVYRAQGLCSGSPVFSKVASAIAVKTYVDNTVTPGNYCFHVTATYQGMESGPSNTAAAPVPTFAPGGLNVVVQ